MGHLLVIEDDADVRALIRRYLEKAGHCVTEAANGETGLQFFRALTVDIVMTDIVMPGQDGLEVIRAVKALRPATNIIAISGQMAQTGTLLNAAKVLGACCVLAKPFTRQDLLSTVDGCFSMLRSGS
jgi:CheY-like chemotaxis protein